MPQVEGLGHVGLYVHDVMKQRDFYTRVLGLKIADEDLARRGGMVFLSADPEREHHELLLMAGRDVPPGTHMVQQISFRVSSIGELRSFYRLFTKEGVVIERAVSHGNALGLYFQDPEGNTVEVYYKTGIPVPQPYSKPIDLERMSDEELLAIGGAALPR